MVIGVDDAIYAGVALAGTAASANAASNANSTSAGNAWTANLTNMVSQVQNQGFNHDEAVIGRDFNSAEAAKNREFNAAQGGIARDFNSLESQKNRDFQENMSNTQYQRAIADMKAAGLNPMLAYSKGGAGNVSGSAASISQSTGSQASGGQASSGSAPGAVVPNVRVADYGQMATGALNAMSQKAQIDNIDADTALKNKQAGKTEAETTNVTEGLNVIKAQVQQILADTYKKGMETRNTKEEIELKEKANQVFMQMNALEQQRQKGQISETAARTELLRLNAQTEKLGLPGLENAAEFERKLGKLGTDSDSSGLGAKALGVGGNTAKTVVDVIKMLRGR